MMIEQEKKYKTTESEKKNKISKLNSTVDALRK